MRLIRELPPTLALVSVFAVTMVLGASPAISQVHPSAEPLEIIDARKEATAEQERALVSSQQRRVEQQLRSRYPNLRIRWNPLTGTPRTLYNLGGFLTEIAPGLEPAEVVMDFMRSNSTLFGLSAADLESLSITRRTVSEGSRVARKGITKTLHHVALDQRWQGRQVYPASLVASVTAKGRLVSLAGELVPNLSGAVNATEPDLTPVQAVERAAESVEVEFDTSQHQPITEPAGPERRQTLAGGSDFTADVPVRLIYYVVSRESVRLVWEAIVGKAGDPYAYQVLVDAQTGDILLRVTITDNDTPQWRAFADVLSTPVVDPRDDVRPLRSPAPLSPGPATPNGAQGVLVASTLIQTNGDPGQSPGGWITPAVNITTGNNVIAFVDLDSDSVADPGEQPTASIVIVGGTPTRTFDFTADFTAAPTTAVNRNAATANVFFLANWYHDRLSALGFDEGAGNFQQNNFTLSGVAGDPILARLQVCFDNSFFSTPVADGTCCPTLQACTFTGPTPDRDAAFDGEVMMHEFTHGLTNRIIGGPNVRGLSGSGQPRGLGEGYSDIYTLLLLSEPTDDIDGNYALGGWVTRELIYVTPQPPPWLDNYSFGIRHFPYSTDLCTYPLTLVDMQTATYDITPIASANCGATPPVSPWLATASGSSHDMGEIWAATLWEVRRNLITKHGSDVGNELSLQLITDSLFLLFQNPTFIEARDAVVQADVARTGGENLSCIWEGFAKRGFGAGAQTPTSGAFTEDFTSAVLGTCAGVQPKRAFSIHVGIVDPVGSFSSVLDNGRTLNLDYVRTINLNLAWDVRLGFSQFDGKSGFPDLDVWTLAGNLKYTINPGAPITVFVNGGGGLYDLDPGDLEGGYNLGFGLARVVGSTLTLEATYNRHSTFTASPDLEYNQFQVGWLFSF